MTAILDLINEYPVVLALAIFLARIGDVTFGIIRILVGFRGYRLLASLIGFCEAFIWVIAASKVIGHLDHWYLAVAYAAGYATGNFVGISIEQRIGVGRELARIISFRQSVDLTVELAQHGYAAVAFTAARGSEPAQVLYVVDKRRRMPALLKLVHQLDPAAIYTVSDVKSCHGEDEHPLDAMPGSRGLALRFKRK